MDSPRSGVSRPVADGVTGRNTTRRVSPDRTTDSRRA
jgi:hypothetical protein